MGGSEDGVGANERRAALVQETSVQVLQFQTQQPGPLIRGSAFRRGIVRELAPPAVVRLQCPCLQYPRGGNGNEKEKQERHEEVGAVK